MRFLEEKREWRLFGLWYADDLVLCGESEENLKAEMRRIVELCRRGGLKIKVNGAEWM